jgi:hypothetical protein
MPCEKYQAALIDVAATGIEPFGDVRVHLAACASCRSYIEQEQFLLVAINSGVRASVNAGLPVALVQRLEARFAQAAAPRRRAFPVWTLAGAGAAVLAVALLTISRPLNLFRSHTKVDATVASSIKGSEFPEISTPAARTSSTTAFVSITPKSVHRHEPETTPKTATPDEREPEVLVPSDEREALARFVHGLRGQPGVAGALLARAPERAESAFPLPLIQIARLEIPPLEPPDGRDTAASEK